MPAGGPLIFFYPDTTTPADATRLHGELLAAHVAYKEHDDIMRLLVPLALLFVSGAIDNDASQRHVSQTLRDMPPAQHGVWVTHKDDQVLRTGLSCRRYTELMLALTED